MCPECGAPRVKVQPFRSRAYETCINPACPTNREPDVDVGACPACAEAGREGRLVAHKSEKSGKRFIRCTNYDDCGTSYPLPAPRRPGGHRRDVPGLRRAARGGDHRPRPLEALSQHELPRAREEGGRAVLARARTRRRLEEGHVKEGLYPQEVLVPGIWAVRRIMA